MEHTKGRWEAKPNADGSWVVMSGNIVIATFFRKDFPAWNKANAHLIAAAPDLLAACKMALDHATCQDEITMLKVAIAKAQAQTSRQSVEPR